MDLQDYTKRKNELSEQLQKLQILADDLQLKNQAKGFCNSIMQLEHETFELAVVGEFSRGKSTFINAMLGRKILPASKNPTTTVISKIVYGDEPSYDIVYKTGKIKQLDEKAFLKLTAPKKIEEEDFPSWKKYLGMETDLSKIDYALVSYPLQFCRDNVEIVDTPGINDINDGRVDITYRYLNQADAVIMVLSANQAFTESEMEFLRQQVRNNQISDIFFVINFKDVLKTEHEEQDVMDYVRGILEKLMEEWHHPLNVYLLSSKKALFYRRKQNGDRIMPSSLRWVPATLEETGFPDFEKALGSYLTDEKGAAKLRKYVERGVVGASALEKDLHTRIEISKHSADEIQQKIVEMKPVFDKSRRDARQIVDDMKFGLNSMQSKLQNVCLDATQNIRTVINKAIDDYDGEWSSEAISRAVGRAMGREKTKLIEAVKQHEEDAFKTEFAKAQKAMMAIWEDVDAGYQTSWNLSAVVMDEEDNIDIDLSMPDDDGININSIINGAGIGAIIAGVVGGAVLPFMILGGLAAKFFGSSNSNENSPQRQKDKLKRDLHKHYRAEYEKIEKQVFEQYQELVVQYCKKLENMMQARIEDMQGQLQVVINQKTMKEQDAAKQQQHLSQMLKEVQNIRQHLTAKAVVEG